MNPINPPFGDPLSASHKLTCSVCHRANTSLFNLGELGKPRWVCLGCGANLASERDAFRDALCTIHECIPDHWFLPFVVGNQPLAEYICNVLAASQPTDARTKELAKVSTLKPDHTPVGVPTHAELFHALDIAWGIIANASGGDWSKQSKEWQDAAARWRDEQLHANIHRFGGHAQARAGTPTPSGASNAPDWTSLSRDDLVFMASRLQAECDQLRRASEEASIALNHRLRETAKERDAYASERDTLRATVQSLRDSLSSTTPYLKRLAVEHNPFAADTLAAVQDALDATKETP